MITIRVDETPNPIQELLSQLTAENEIVFMKGETAIARLVSLATWVSSKDRIPGLNAGVMLVDDGFDDPLPDSFWLGEE
jgi:hypothetical protein